MLDLDFYQGYGSKYNNDTNSDPGREAISIGIRIQIFEKILTRIFFRLVFLNYDSNSNSIFYNFETNFREQLFFNIVSKPS